MAKLSIRVIFCIVLYLLCICLTVFSDDLSTNEIISIAIIVTFLILFTYVFNTQAIALNVFVILVSFMCLPLFILIYLGVPNSIPWPMGGVLLLVVTAIIGFLAVYAIVKLNFIEIKFESD